MADRVDGTFGNAVGCMPAIKIRALCVIVLMSTLGIRE